MKQRPVQPKKSEETRRRILEAALTLFQEKGYEEATMRNIAERASVALGAAYYYFESKEKLVLAYYQETQREMEEQTETGLPQLRGLKERLQLVLDLKFRQLKPYHKFLGVLFRTAVNPSSPISPFGKETGEIREGSVRLFKEVIEGCDMQIPSDLRTQLPRLLWLYQMGLILFWLHDHSRGQSRTKQLQEKSLNLIINLIRIAKLPLMGPLRRSALDLVNV